MEDTRPREQTIWQVKQDVCEVGRRIWTKGFCAGNEGNHSVRVGPDRVVCTPTGLSKGFLEREDIIVTDLDGKQVEPNSRGRKPTSEVKVHLAIYKKRQDVKAVIHSHPPHATTFAIAGIPLPEGIHPEAEVFLGTVPFAPYATPSKQDLPDSITPLIGPQTNSVLMGNHGTVSFSHSLIDTYYRLEILDAYCRILLLCHQFGKANVLSPKQMHELLEVKHKFGLPDDRIRCALDGCYTEHNQPFFSQFDDQPVSASCSCSTGSEAAAGIPVADDPAFEAMVQAITDQIMNAVNPR